MKLGELFIFALNKLPECLALGCLTVLYDQYFVFVLEEVRCVIGYDYQFTLTLLLTKDLLNQNLIFEV
jgi:hypothetical protein